MNNKTSHIFNRGYRDALANESPLYYRTIHGTIKDNCAYDAKGYELDSQEDYCDGYEQGMSE